MRQGSSACGLEWRGAPPGRPYANFGVVAAFICGATFETPDAGPANESESG